MSLNKPILTLIISTVFLLTAKSQQVNTICTENVSVKNIRTVLFYQKGNELSMPNIQLDSDEKLVLKFDDLDNEVKDYYYSITHCTKDWKKSDLNTSFYSTGFNDNQIVDYEYSFNTLVPYVNYTLELPNDDMSILKSGNYIVDIYTKDNGNQIKITKRFTVYEPLTKVKVKCTRLLDASMYNSGQELYLEIDENPMYITNPYSQLFVSVLQNGDWNNRIDLDKPDFLRDGKVIYNNSEKIVFDAGNEFRYVDLKNEKYNSERIKNTTIINDYYFTMLHDDLDMLFEPYFYSRDINGKYLVKRDTYDNSHVEADYVFVHFTLNYNKQITLGKPYLYGALTNWDCNGNNQMKWNPEIEKYELTIMLKQGYYNYKYVTKLPNDVIKQSIFSGSHYETQNLYNVYIYLTDLSYNYDRLICTSVVNSNKTE